MFGLIRTLLWHGSLFLRSTWGFPVLNDSRCSQIHSICCDNQRCLLVWCSLKQSCWILYRLGRLRRSILNTLRCFQIEWRFLIRLLRNRSGSLGLLEWNTIGWSYRSTSTNLWLELRGPWFIKSGSTATFCLVFLWAWVCLTWTHSALTWLKNSSWCWPWWDLHFLCRCSNRWSTLANPWDSADPCACCQRLWLSWL